MNMKEFDKAMNNLVICTEHLPGMHFNNGEDREEWSILTTPTGKLEETHWGTDWHLSIYLDIMDHSSMKVACWKAVKEACKKAMKRTDLYSLSTKEMRSFPWEGHRQESQIPVFLTRATALVYESSQVGTLGTLKKGLLTPCVQL